MIESNNIDDIARIEALGFVKNPRCPLPIVVPNESADWFNREWACMRRYRRQDKINYIKAVEREFDILRAKMPDLEILNICLEEMITERFMTAYGRKPSCDLDKFLFTPGKSKLRRPTW